MPIYEYECTHCGHRFELKQGFHDQPQAACPQCQQRARRVFQPAPIIFKGSGFYVTDHRKGGDSAKEKESPNTEKAKTEARKGSD